MGGLGILLVVSRLEIIFNCNCMPQFRLKDTMCALTLRGGKRVMTKLPAGALLDPRPSRAALTGMVDVMSEQQIYSVFEWDLAHKAERVMSSMGSE
jgi:hypothetical protein